MNDGRAPARSLEAETSAHVETRRFAWPPRIASGSEIFRDVTAGVLGSVVLIGNIISFGGLMFPDELSVGIQTAIWAMLIGSGIGGLWIALATSLPPLAAGIDSPTGAVLVLLSAAAGSRVLAVGGSPEVAVHTVMLIFTIATLLSGMMLFVLGACGWGHYLRFVPYFVIGGFLAATGWFLIAGGLRMVTGRTLTFASLATEWTTVEIMNLGLACVTLATLLALRRWSKSAYALPGALVTMCLTGALILRSLGLDDAEHGWYLPSPGLLTNWSPVTVARSSPIDWPAVLEHIPETLAVGIVALISLVTKVSSIEVARQTSGDLDRELRAHGAASLIAAPFGGLVSGMQIGTSRLLEQAGAATRLSGVVCALTLGMVGLASFNLPGLIPIPIVAGLVFLLGYGFIVETLWRPFSQRAWFDLLFAVAIMIVCIGYGYLVGISVGLICACCLFAISYARIGVVRRHATRAHFASNVDRSLDAGRHLREVGDAIYIYWLSGYIFFGSSESVFERIRDDIEAQTSRQVVFVILDFGMVSGVDSSAFVSLAKLRNFCDQRSVAIVYSSVSSANRAALERGGFFGDKSRHRSFADLDTALAWCEDQMLRAAGLDTDSGLAGFEPWLQRQLGEGVKCADILAYLERKDIAASQVIYRQGEPADTVDLVAIGKLTVDIVQEDGSSLHVRRIETQTVVGEMGFFRRATRSATVSSDGPAILYTLKRTHFEKMRRERPDLASAFDDFILRILSDRIEFANCQVSSLSQ
ncbi:MAG TPA: SulP family inorganic anion transporter [Candidatus Binatia bacterium]|nr:SulP family inorganic anion transporter [Candidatus Binatia bacterium]